MKKSTPIQWICDKCGFPVADGAGVVAIPFTEINDPPEYGGRWRAVHTTCADFDDYYGIDIEHLRDPLGLLWWTAHLFRKGWVRDTTWDALLSKVYEDIRAAEKKGA